MVGFLDIAEEGQRGLVLFRGKQVDLVGLSSRQLARLVLRFDTLRELMDGKKLTVIKLIKTAPDAVHELIAYGTGHDELRDKKRFDLAVEKAADLSIGEQAEFVMAILDVSLGEKLNPFVKGLARDLASRAGEAVKGAEVEAGKRLRLPSKASLRSVTTPEMFGATPPDKSPPIPN